MIHSRGLRRVFKTRRGTVTAVAGVDLDVQAGEDSYAPIVFIATLPLVLLSGVLLPLSLAPAIAAVAIAGRSFNRTVR